MNAWTRTRVRPSVRTSILFTAAIVTIICVLFIAVSFVYAKTLVVEVDGESTRVTTFKQTVGDALVRSKLNIYPEDKVSPARETPVTEGLEIKVVRSKPFMLSIDNTSIQSRSAAQTVGEAIRELSEQYDLNINEYDEVSIDRNKPLSEEMNIKVERAIPIQVVADGKEWVTHMAPRTVGEALARLEITLGELDKLSLPLNHELKANDQLKVTRVEEKIETLETTIPYQTVAKPGDFPLGLPDRVINAGKNGIQEQTVKIVYVDGQESDREVVTQKIISSPVSRTVARGNLTQISRGGKSFGFRRAYQMKASAYSDPGGITATGHRVRVGIVAVDPRVIPLGTKLYIEGYGEAVALDTGGAIKGNKVDLYMNSVKEALNWGVRSVTVYVK